MDPPLDMPEDETHQFLNKVPSKSNPIFVHAVERSWTFIFNCSDVSLIESCGREKIGPCGCDDE